MSERKYTSQQIAAKIQKLLALADDTTNPNVAAEAAAKAQQLMQEWALSEEQVRGASSAPARKVTQVDVPYMANSWLKWEDWLAVAVGKAMLCYVLHSSKRKVFVFMGQPGDLQIATYTFEHLRNTLSAMSKRALSEHSRSLPFSIYNEAQCRRNTDCHPTVYRSRWLLSWLMGAVSGISEQFRAQAVKFTESSSTALVLVETRLAKAKEYAEETFPNTQPPRNKAVRTFNQAYEDGVDAGRKLQVRPGIEAGTQLPALKGGD